MSRPCDTVFRGGVAEQAPARLAAVVAGVPELPDPVLDQDPAALADLGVPLALFGAEDRPGLAGDETHQFRRELVLGGDARELRNKQQNRKEIAWHGQHCIILA